MTDRAEILARELEDSYRSRALLYWSIYDELRREVGAERAEAILGRAIERRGAAAGAALFATLAERTPASVAQAFLAVSPNGGTMYPHEVQRDPDGAVHVKVTRCPLKDAWTEAGLGSEDLQTICRIAGRFDTGCFGRSGVAFSADTWAPGSTGCCRLHLRPANPPHG